MELGTKELFGLQVQDISNGWFAWKEVRNLPDSKIHYPAKYIAKKEGGA